MDAINPILVLIWDVKLALESGKSVMIGVESFLKRNQKDEIILNLAKWRLSQINSTHINYDENLSSMEKAIFSLLTKGHRGASILETLKSIEHELVEASEDDIKAHLAKLPLILMIPLMLFIFPSIFLILIGPIIFKLF